MVVTVAIRKPLQADGIEQHQRGLDEFTAIGIGEINHSTHHKCGHGGGVVSDVVIDPRRQQRKSSSPDARISAKLIDHKLDRGDDRKRIRGSRVDGNPMNGPVRCEQVLPDGHPGCRLIIRLAC